MIGTILPAWSSHPLLEIIGGEDDPPPPPSVQAKSLVLQSPAGSGQKGFNAASSSAAETPLRHKSRRSVLPQIQDPSGTAQPPEGHRRQQERRHQELYCRDAADRCDTAHGAQHLSLCWFPIDGYTTRYEATPSRTTPGTAGRRRLAGLQWGGLRQFKVPDTEKMSAVFGMNVIAYKLIRLGNPLRPAITAS